MTEIRKDHNGQLDEIIGRCNLERMGADSWILIFEETGSFREVRLSVRGVFVVDGAGIVPDGRVK
jgi:hypothetical protein